METGLNAIAYVDKQPIMVATASTEHPIGWRLRLLREIFMQQTQVPANNRNARSKQWQP